MSLIRVKFVEPGMVTAADVFDQSGRLLFSADTTITEKHIKILKSWGVTEITIQGDEESTQAEPELPAIDPALVEAARQHVEQLFSYSASDAENPYVIELKRLALQRKIASFQGRG